MLSAGIRTKLVTVLLSIGLVPTAFVALSTWRLSGQASLEQERIAREALRDAAVERLNAVGAGRAETLERYFDLIESQVRTLSGERMVVDGARRFAAAFERYLDQRGEPAEAERGALAGYYESEFGAAYARANEGRRAPVDALLAALGPTGSALQADYIARNPHPLGSKHELVRAGRATDYDAVHAELHPSIREFLEEFGYYDIFIVEPEHGHVVYSVFKELDFGTSLTDGAFADSGLGRAYREALALTEHDAVAFDDFDTYRPSYEAPASFVASPIVDGDERVGVLVFQMPLDRITQVSSSVAGLGTSGDAILIGPDGLPRSDSRFDPRRSVARAFRAPEESRLDHDAIASALAGGSGSGELEGLDGEPVIADWRPVHVADETWALFSTMDEVEALAGVAAIEASTAAAASRLLAWQFGIGLAVLVVVPALASQIGRRLSRPIVDTAEALERTAAGDLGAALEVTGRDELATMAEALNGTLGALRETFGSDRVHWPELAASRAANQRLEAMVEQSPACMVQADADLGVRWMNGASERAAATVGLAGRTLSEFFGPDVPAHELRDAAGLPRTYAFERGGEHLAVEVSAIRDGAGDLVGLLAIWEVRTEEARVRELFTRTASQLVDTAGRLESASRTLLESADATAERAQLAADESAEVSSGQTQISAATEQMTSSIAAILDTTRDLAGATRRAVESASSATRLVEILRQANGRISSVTETIASIADQTNLLALNATIEAAGAGDAGRGFAVVASEVKELARETMQATHAIDEQVGDISGRSEDVAGAFQQISEVIERLDELAAAVAQSVTEQRSATGEIAASVGDNASRSERITAELDGVREAVDGVRATARELLGTVDQLGGLARTLDGTAARR